MLHYDMIPFDGKVEFSAVDCFSNHSNMRISAQETFLFKIVAI